MEKLFIYKCVQFISQWAHPRVLCTCCNMFMVWGSLFSFLMAAKGIQITVKLQAFKKDIFLDYLQYASLEFLIK